MSEGATEYWFKPKRHGYGAMPTHWKGWLVTSAFAVLLPLVSVPWLLSLTDETRLVGMIAWAVAVLAAVYWFTSFAKRKTDGDWVLRWNGKTYQELLEEKALEEKAKNDSAKGRS